MQRAKVSAAEIVAEGIDERGAEFYTCLARPIQPASLSDTIAAFETQSRAAMGILWRVISRKASGLPIAARHKF